MKQFVLTLISVALCFLCSCMAPQEPSIVADVTFLSGEECSGRLYNTQGSRTAETYIEQQLANANFLPLVNGSMKQPFLAQVPTDICSKLTLTNQTESVSLVENVDYVPPIWDSLDLSGTLSEETVVDGVSAFEVVSEDTVKMNIVESQYYTGWKGRLPGAIPTLLLTDSGLEKIRAFQGTHLSYSCQSVLEPIELHNIMAVLPGEDHSKAVVLGAHFDHMGQAGGQLYAGALDNASGVSVLLNTARLLSDAVPETDIVFAFWNLEEHGQLGSKAGADLLEDAYDEICYINIDCVGLLGGGPVHLSTANQSTCFQNELVDLFQQNSYSNILASNDYIPSDHVSFSFCNSVNLSQAFTEISGQIHLPSDLPEILDYDDLEALSRALADVLMNRSASLVETERNVAFQPEGDILWPEADYSTLSSYSEKIQYQNELAKQLAYNQYVQLPDGYLVHRTNATTEDVQKFYPGLDITEYVEGFTLAGLDIYDGGISIGDASYGTVQTWLPSKETLSSICLTYVLDETAVEYRQMCESTLFELDTTQYDSVELLELETGETAWLCHSKESSGYRLRLEYEESCIEIKVGTPHTNLYGETRVLLNDDLNQGEFLAVALPILSAGSLINFD